MGNQYTKDMCKCGKLKTKVSRECWECFTAGCKKQSKICPKCGDPKNRGASLCAMCRRFERRYVTLLKKQATDRAKTDKKIARIKARGKFPARGKFSIRLNFIPTKI